MKTQSLQRPGVFQYTHIPARGDTAVPWAAYNTAYDMRMHDLNLFLPYLLDKQ